MTATQRRRRVDPHPVVLAALVVAFAVVAAIIAAQWHPVARLDREVADALNRQMRRHPGEVSWWRAVSSVLHPDVLRVLLVGWAVVLALGFRRRGTPLFIAVCTAGTALLGLVAKAAFARHRPTFAHPVASADGWSFPSGHAMTSMAAALVMLLLVGPRWRFPVAAFGAVGVLLVGLSRVFLGVHYPTDVIGGWLLAAAWVVAVHWAFRRVVPPEWRIRRP